MSPFPSLHIRSTILLVGSSPRRLTSTTPSRPRWGLCPRSASSGSSTPSSRPMIPHTLTPHPDTTHARLMSGSLFSWVGSLASPSGWCRPMASMAPRAPLVGATATLPPSCSQAHGETTRRSQGEGCTAAASAGMANAAAADMHAAAIYAGTVDLPRLVPHSTLRTL